MELCDEAVRPARQLHRLVPDDAETTGLLALLLLQHSRTAARYDEDGRFVAPAEPDAVAWPRVADLYGLLARLALIAPVLAG